MLGALVVPPGWFYSFFIPVVEYSGEVIVLEELLPRRNDWCSSVCFLPDPLLFQTILVGTNRDLLLGDMGTHKAQEDSQVFLGTDVCLPKIKQFLI